MAWNNPEIGIQWPQVVGKYPGSASSEGYHLEDGTPLNLSEKDMEWMGIKVTFKF
jgi:dTDP-4-dehydrorhamnose 3,5-epimerase